jgi:hypothetical protein
MEKKQKTTKVAYKGHPKGELKMKRYSIIDQQNRFVN